MRLESLIAVLVIAYTNAFTVNPTSSCKNVISKSPMRSVTELNVANDSFGDFFAGLSSFFSGKPATPVEKKITTAKVAEVKYDISIPYDAAANLAYFEWKGDLPYNEKSFQMFKKIYEEKTVTEVSQKRALREFAEAIKKSDDELATLLTTISTK